MELNEIAGLTEEQTAAIQKLLQSETDKVRTDYSGKLKVVSDELNKYKPAEKSPQELELEARLKALEDKEKELNKKEQQALIANKFKEKGLPVELSTFVNLGEDIDTGIETVATALNSFYLNSNHKPESHTNVGNSISREQFKKMSYMERAELHRSNPTLYKLLTKNN